MQIISIVNQKGGVGKTASCAALAAEMTRAGYKVLTVDADPQGNLTRMTATTHPAKTLYDLLNGEAGADAIVAARNGDLIVSDTRLGERDSIKGERPEWRLKAILDGVRGYDTVLIDCPPSLGLLTVGALISSSKVIIPARPDRFSLDGLREIHGTISAIRHTANKHLAILGIIVTQFISRSKLHSSVLEALTIMAKQIDTKIYLPAIRQTVAAQTWQYAGYVCGDSKAAQDYAEVAEQIMNDMNLKRR